MALTLPQEVVQDGRSGPLSYDANVTVWPIAKGNYYDLNVKTGWATRSTTINGGPDAGRTDTVEVDHNGIRYFLPVNLAVAIPLFLYTLLTQQVAGSNVYSVS